MAKTVSRKRKSESTAATITPLEFNNALQEYYGNNTKLVALGAEMDDHIQEIMDQYNEDIDLIQGKQALLFAVIKAYVMSNKESLFEAGKKSFENLYAKIGIRTNTPSLKLVGKNTWESVLDKLANELPDYVRKIEEPDKAKLIADRDKEGVADKFEEIGIKVSQTEKFYVELKKVELAE